MVDYSTLTELELYRDGQTGEFIARDPSDGTEYAVPFKELNAGTANIDSLGQNVDAGSNNISNAGSVDADSVNTDDATITDSINYPVSVPSDKSSNRSFGTWEQNTTGAPLMIVVVAEASASATQIRMDLSINTSQNVNLADNVSVTGDTGTRVSVQGVVADQNYYQVRNFEDTADYSIFAWYEYNNGA